MPQTFGQRFLTLPALPMMSTKTPKEDRSHDLNP
jgi:hypothetical protein